MAGLCSNASNRIGARRAAARQRFGQAAGTGLKTTNRFAHLLRKIRSLSPPVLGRKSLAQGIRIQRIGKKTIAIHCYLSTYVPMSNANDRQSHVEIERVQTGVRLEKKLLKVLKAVAELKDMSLGDLLEGIVLHAFEGKSAFTRDTLKEIEQLKTIYGLTLSAEDSHKLRERSR